MKYLLILLVFMLQGCSAVFIPAFAVDAVHDKITGEHGDHCVSELAKVGDQVKIPDQGVGTITQLFSTSYKCKRWDYPIWAQLSF